MCNSSYKLPLGSPWIDRYFEPELERSRNMPGEKLGEEAVQWLGVSYKTILSSDATNGAMSITDSMSPAGSGPPRHVHQKEDETFVILTGECEFWVAGETFIRREGETAFIPRGTDHTFRVVGSRPSRHLLILTPGGFEGFFMEMASGQFRIPENMEEINECAARYNLSFTGPPLGG
jgi:quercetin dioxygenase-like cupin family protein